MQTELHLECMKHPASLQFDIRRARSLEVNSLLLRIKFDLKGLLKDSLYVQSSDADMSSDFVFNVSQTCANLTSNFTNLTELCMLVNKKLLDVSSDGGSGDATWILTSAFIIFTMQSGFGLLEAGSVSAKNECNIMIKNMIDVIFGGLSYWLFGYGFSFGTSKGSNEFSGFGSFLTDADHQDMGHVFSQFFFQLSFATTATTIVSGAMAERTRLEAYMFYSFINTLTYVFPAHWMWSEKGFLNKIGAVDIAGAGPVHLVGGFSALIATLYLKPRKGRFDSSYELEMASPTNAVLGTFMLWWGWLGFNCGSTFGVSKGKWKLASRAAINTISASIGGALFAVIYSCKLNKKYQKKLNVALFTSGILGGLVGITAICTLCRPWEAYVIGIIGGALSCVGIDLLEWMKIDDPVGCFPVHGIAGVWGLVAVGLFAETVSSDNTIVYGASTGILKGGKIMFMGAQVVACLCIIVWAMIANLIEFILADFIFGLRVSEEEEFLGADFCEHGINRRKNEKNMDKSGSEDKEEGRRGQVNAVCYENCEEDERGARKDGRQYTESNQDIDRREVEEHGYITDSLEVEVNL